MKAHITAAAAWVLGAALAFAQPGAVGLHGVESRDWHREAACHPPDASGTGAGEGDHGRNLTGEEYHGRNLTGQTTTDVAVAADGAVMPVLRVLLASIGLHAPRSFVHIVTTSEVVSGANTAACVGLEGCDGARARRLANVLNFARFHLAELLPELDRVIWMDCDVIVRRPLAAVAAAALEHSEALLSAFAEPQRFGRFYLEETAVFGLMGSRFQGLQLDGDAESFNDGVISINLRRWREVEATKTFAWLAAQHRSTEPGLWKYGTQPAMMLLGVAYGWERLDATWYHGDLGFKSAHEDDLDKAVFLHFDGERKPWKEGGLNKELWRPYAEHADASRQAAALLEKNGTADERRDECDLGRPVHGSDRFSAFAACARK